ncbi:MAG: lipopolysaccharide biosynthesis protein [Actinomycetota bacterium]
MNDPDKNAGDSGEDGLGRAARMPLWRRAGSWLVEGATTSVPFRTAVPMMMGLRGVGIAVSFASSVLIARALGPFDKGIYNLFVLIPVVYATVLDLGVTNGNFFYLARGELDPGIAYTNVVTDVLGTLLIVSVPFALLARGPLANTFSGVPPGFLVFAMLFLGPLTLHGLMVSGGLLMGTNRAMATYMIPAAMQLVVLAGAIGVAAGRFGLTGMVVAFTGATVLGQMLVFAAFHRGLSMRLSLRPAALIRSARFGAPLYLATLFSFLHGRADQLLIAGTLRPSELGQYALAVAIGETLWSIDMPLIAATQYEIAHRAPDASADLVDRTTRLIVLSMTAACGIAALTASWFIPFVYGGPYRPATHALLAYLPGVLFWSVARSLSQDIGYQRARTDLVLYIKAVSLAANLGLLALLLRPLGIVGASLASSGSYLVLLGLAAAIHCRLARVRLRHALVPTRRDLAWLRDRVREYAARGSKRAPR